MVTPAPDGTLGSTLDLLHLFGDATRLRLLALVARHELSGADLVGITGVPQSRVSTHLGKLRDAGVVRDRKVGSSTLWALDADMPEAARRVFSLVSEQVKDPAFDDDRRRCEALLLSRAKGGWPESVAGEMERHYSPGRTWEATATAFVGLMRLGDVLDVGSGDGTIAELLAPRARNVTCIDRSDAMVEAARRRLARFANASVVHGDMDALPFDDASFDDVLLLNVLGHAKSAARVVGEAARVLRPSGSVVVVTLAPHHHLDVTRAYGHVNAGIAPAALRKLLVAAGLEPTLCDVTSREKRKPHFSIVTAFASKPNARRKVRS